MSFFLVSQKRNSVELGSDDKNDIDKIKNVIQKTGLSNMAGIDNIRIKRLVKLKVTKINLEQYL